MFSGPPTSRRSLLHAVSVGALMLSGARAGHAQNVDFTSVPLPPGPGSVRGLVDGGEVQPSVGAYTYAMPIDVPDYAGLKPSLSLSYSSAAGNGLLGGGWDIVVPLIRRSTRSGIPTYTSSDQFELIGLEGGGRLVPDSSEPNWYWVEGHGRKLRVRFVNDASFEITDENGNVYVLGANVGGVLIAPDNVRVAEWRLQSVTTLAGTQIGYGYLRDQTQMYPSSITWGPAQGGTPVFRVDFTYDPRSDTSTSYRYGFRVTTRQRLRSVKVSSFGEIAHGLGFTYAPGTGLTRLTAIQQYGRGGVGGLPPLTVTYSSAYSFHSGPSGDFNGWTPGVDPGVIWLDLDRDGYTDLIRFDGSGTCPYRRNMGGSFGTPVNIGCPALTLDQFDIADLDGDGFLDLATKSWPFLPYTVYQIHDASFQSIGTWTGTDWMQHGTTFVDINGDGRADAIWKYNSDFVYALNSATGFGAPVTVTPNVTNQLLALDVRRMVDFNRDGIVDYYTIANNTLSLYYGKGDMTFEHYTDVPFVTRQSSATLANSPDRLRFSDFDNDGVIDAVEISTVMDFYRGHGDMSGFDAPSTIDSSQSPERGVVDLDGNGSLDAFTFASDLRLAYTDLAGSDGTGQGAFIHELDNGLGAVVYVYYDSTGDLNHIAASAGNPWNTNIPIAFPVCTWTSTYFGLAAPSRSIQFQPSNPVWDPNERAFAGFGSEVTTNYGATNADTLVVTKLFYPGLDESRELRGVPQFVSRADGDGNSIDWSSLNWTTQRVASLPDNPLLYVPIKQSELDFVAGSAGVLASSSFDYDAEGRVIRSTEAGRWDVAGDERIREWDYVTPDDTTWVRDKVCATRLKLGDGSDFQIADSQYLYGDDMTTAPLCEPGRGWPREVLRYLDTDGRYVTAWSQSYDAVGNATYRYDGHVGTQVGFDPLGLRPVTHSIPVSFSTTLHWSIEWDDVLGRVQQVIAPSGTVDHYTYDDFGRLLSAAKDSLPPHHRYDYAWSVAGGTYPTTTEWWFDGDTGELASGAQPWPSGSKWRGVTHVMNGLFEPLYTSVPTGNGQYKISDYVTRDGRGRVNQAFAPFYATMAFPTSVPSNTSVTIDAFDALNRPVLRTNPMGAQTSFTYDALTRTVAYPDVAPETATYDGLGRVTHVERTVNGTAETADYTYDPADNLNTISLQGGAVQSAFGHDSLGRLTSASDPDTGYQSWAYDDAGRVIAHVNGASDYTRWEYDGAGRLTRKGVGPWEDDVNDYVYHYDEPRAETDQRVNGRLAWIQEPNGELEVSYDEFGNVNYKRRTVSGSVGTRSSVYSPSGLRLRESFDDGFSYTNSFDPAGRLVSAGSYWTAELLDAADRSVVEHYGNGVHEVHDFDPLGLLQEVIVRRPDGAAVLDVGIQRNPSGRPWQVSDYDGVGLERSASFYYDDGGRLYFSDYYTPSDPASERYFESWYDPLQNFYYRFSEGDTSTLIDGLCAYGENGHGPRQLTSVTPWSDNPMPTQFDYDGAGRQTRQFDAALAYDAFDRLVSISTPPGGVGPGNRVVNEQFSYGADGLRTSVSDAEGTRERWFDSDWREVNGARQHFLSVGSRQVAEVTTSGGTSSAIYLHQGLSAGPELMTGSGGASVEERSFEPFGQPQVSSNGSFDFTDHPMNGLNQPTDAASGLSFHGARWYSPEVGRWLTPDPAVAAPSPTALERPWGLNPYQYAEQNPLMFWDADGLQPWPYDTYQSLEQARVAASSDILIRIINAGVEYKTRIYRGEDGDYFYAEPWTGTNDHPEGEPHRVEAGDEYQAGAIPDGAVAVYDEHGHPTYAFLSGQDMDKVAPWLAAQGMGMGIVDNNGDIHSVIDGEDVVVGHVDADTLAQLKAYREARDSEDQDRSEMDALNAMSTEFQEADQTAAFMYKLGVLAQNPGAYVAAKGQEIEDTSCYTCLFNPLNWF